MGVVIDKKFCRKRAKIFSEHNAKISPENSLPLLKNPKTETISLDYDVNDHV